MLKLASVFEKPEMWAQVKSLYQSAFPAAERAPLFYLRAKAKKPMADFYAVCEDEAFAGLLYEVYHRDIVFVFYLAVNPLLRGRGYGSRILATIREGNAGKRVILNIETADADSANYEERVKRKRFYLKNGVAETGLFTKEGNVAYEMLGWGGDVSYGEYAELIKNYMGAFLYRLLYKKLSWQPRSGDGSALSIREKCDKTRERELPQKFGNTQKE